jgi:hypothetical protein
LSMPCIQLSIKTPFVTLRPPGPGQAGEAGMLCLRVASANVNRERVNPPADPIQGAIT